MTGIQYLDLPAIYGAVQQFQAGRQRSRLLDLQAEMEQQKFARATTAYEAQQALVNSIADPQRRLAATIAPDKFVASIFRDPKDNYSATEGGLWDYSGDKPVFTPNPNAGLGVAPLPGPGANLQGAAPPSQSPRTIATGPRKPVQGEVPAIYAQHIEDAAAVSGVDPGVLGRMLLKETAPGGPLVSRAGAKGVMQFMDPTARQYGVDVNDPASSIRGAAQMLGTLLKKYGGDYRLAVGAYNWGEGNVDRWLAGGGDVSQVPAETMDYVGGIVGINTPGPTDDVGPVAAAHPANAAPPQQAAPQAAPYPPGAVGFKRNNKTGEFVSGNKPGFGILVDAQGNELGSYRLPGVPDEDAAKRQELALKEEERKQKLADAGVKDERDWRQEFKDPVKQATEVTTQIGIIRDSLARKEGTGDIAAIIGFNKLLDPGAVVREADVALTLAAQGLSDKLQTWMANKREGDVLPQPLRDKIGALSEQIQKTSLGVLGDRVMPYRKAVEENGGKWDRIIPPVLAKRFGWDAETPPPPPQPPPQQQAQQQQQAAPPALNERVAGQTYQTPRGPAIWRGNGWELVR